MADTLMTTGGSLAERIASAKSELASRAVEVDRAGRFPSASIAALQQRGLTGCAVPERHGGLGLGPMGDYTSFYEMLWELTSACSSTAQVLMAHSSAIATINMTGTEAQIERFGAAACRGEIFGFFGGEQQQRRTTTGLHRGWTSTLERTDGGWLLNGSKFFATNSTGARWMMVFCTAVDGDREAVATPVVAADAPGVTIHDTWDSVGQRATASGSVDFKDVFVPDENLVGGFGGHDAAPVLAPFFQLNFAAHYVGLAQGALDFAIDYLRTEAPTPLGLESACHDPQIQTRVADISVEIEVARALVIAAAEALPAVESDPGLLRSAFEAVNRAKIASTAVSLRAGSDLFHLCGARVTTRSYDADRFWRNARTLTLHDPVHKRRLALGMSLLDVVDPTTETWMAGRDSAGTH